MTGSTSTEEGAQLEALRAEALDAVRGYAQQALAERPFVPGETSVPVAAKVIGPPELEALVDASLDGWLTEGRFAQRFAPAFARAAGREHALLVGSGSQANLLAVAAACSQLHERPLQPGDEVVTPALGFSTTVSPIYQQGLVPVYVDVDPDTLNPDARCVRRRALRAHPRGRGRPLPRQPLRRGRARGALRRARPGSDRRLLRRARLDPRRPARRNLRRMPAPIRSTRPTT